MTQINAYDDYGIPQGKTPAGVPFSGGTATASFGRFGYTGQAWLPEVGLYHYKNRTYSPTLGRFMQADPIGYADGPNLYAYVGGDPVNLVDPFGLACVATDGRSTGVNRCTKPVNPALPRGFDDAPTSNGPDIVSCAGGPTGGNGCSSKDFINSVIFINEGGRGGGGNGGDGGGDGKDKPPCQGSDSFAGRLGKRSDKLAQATDQAALAAAGLALLTSPTGIVGAVAGGVATGAKVGSALASTGAVAAKVIDGNFRGASASFVDGLVGAAVSRLALSGARAIAGSKGPVSFSIMNVNINNSKLESFSADLFGLSATGVDSIGELIFCRK